MKRLIMSMLILFSLPLPVVSDSGLYQAQAFYRESSRSALNAVCQYAGEVDGKRVRCSTCHQAGWM